MGEGCVRGQVKEFDGLRQQEHGKRCEQRRVRQSDIGADGARVARLVGIVIRRRQLLLGRLNRWRGLRHNPVEMSE